MDVAVSWSGGKDSALALRRALEAGHGAAGLVTVVDPETGRVGAHGVPAELVRDQAEALDLRLELREAGREGYEAAFRAACRTLRDRPGLGGVVFGDVDVAGHREWGERVCGDLGLEALYPLWAWDHGDVVDAAVERGIEAVVVAARDPLDEAVLGEPVDRDLAEAAAAAGASPSGEEGSYHTLVVDGPGFRRPVEVEEGPVRRAGEGVQLAVRAPDPGR